jgi:hypothetical protein
MNLIDKIITEWSWRTAKGYPNVNSQEDLDILWEALGIDLDEAYTFFPKSVDELEDEKLEALLTIIKDYPNLKMEDPLAVDTNKPNKPKISRSLSRDNRFIEYLQDKLGVPVDPMESIKWNGLIINFGEGSRGGRGVASKGLSFEKELEQDLNNYKEGVKEFQHPDLTQDIVQQFDLSPDNFKIVPEGGENKPRPLEFTSEGPIIGFSGPSIAATLTDLTIDKGSEPVYLSLKFGKTLTFFNSGVTKIFTPDDFQDGKIDNAQGAGLLETFGIDNEIFCKIFNEYGKTDFTQYHKQVTDYDQTKLYNLVRSGIGSGYWMVKGGKGKYSFFEVTDEFAKKAATPQGGITILYGGDTGKGKRIDLKFESEYYIFKLNIRNKQGKLYPSHIMCDYVRK